MQTNTNDHLLKTYQGVDIFVDDKGKFWCGLRNKVVSRAALSSIEKIIRENTTTALPACEIDSGFWRIPDQRKITVTGYDARSKRLVKQGPYRDSFTTVSGNVYHCDDETFAEMEQITVYLTTLMERRRAIIKGLRRATADDLAAGNDGPEEGGEQ